MNEHPILFSAEMVRAIVAGHKTQTRRVVKPQFEKLWGYGVPHGYERFGAHVNIKLDPPHPRFGGWKYLFCPYGKAGDRLWVRETFGLTDASMTTLSELKRPGCYDPCSDLDGWAAAIYRADGEWDRPNGEGTGEFVWRPSIFMPRWASRLTLEITGIRVQRVQEISELDCENELGVPPFSLHDLAYPYFHQLWDSINAKRGYPLDSNPFVWVVEFRRVEEK